MIAAAACAPATAQAYELDGIPWPGRPPTITYWNGTGYGPQVAQAARAWNESGARVRLRRVARARAQLLIVEDPRRGGDGPRARPRVRVGRLPAAQPHHGRPGRARGRRRRPDRTRVRARARPRPRRSALRPDEHRLLVALPPGADLLDPAARRRARGDPPLRRAGADAAPRAVPAGTGRRSSVARNAENGRLEATVTLPQADISGVADAAGRRAAARTARPSSFDGREAAAGSVVQVDVTPARDVRRAREPDAVRACLDVRRHRPDQRGAAHPAGRPGARGVVGRSGRAGSSYDECHSVGSRP